VKITKSQLKQIIKEELEEALGEREVLVRGFGKLTLSQIERRLVEMLREAGEGAMKDPPDFYNLKTGMIQAFYEAYRLHKDEERINEVYSEKQRRYMCAMKDADANERPEGLSQKEAEEQCKGPMKKKKKD
tara:strand:- start:2754 stop:3146 length:393 start_codon:yes stop_codon:yes gene_type:complete